MNADIRLKQFAEIKRLIKIDYTGKAFNLLLSAASPDDGCDVQLRCARIFNSLSKKNLQLKPLKVAILASSSTEHLVPILAYWLAKEGFNAEIWAAPFDTLAATVLDPSSTLYTFEPDCIWIMNTWRDIDISAMPGANMQDVSGALDGAIKKTVGLVHAVRARTTAQIVLNNADIPLMEVFGNLGANVAWSFRNLLRQYNVLLAKAVDPGFTIFDFDHLSSVFGKSRWEDPTYWYHSKNAFSFDALGMIAFHFSRLIAAAKGLSKKCLVLDLDNTLWGGVIGDDGMEGIKLGAGAEGEAFVDFQHYIKALKDRGIILAVCSKNDIDNAREPFESHPDMELRLNDIAVFVANWQNKADNIQKIASNLNISLDSLVFCDDNPAERDLVRKFLPMVAVPELPEDPTGYINALQAGCYFETLSFSDDDGNRADYYTANAMRGDLKESFTDLSEFHQDLEMVSLVGEIDNFYRPRAAQLLNKSNQFHLTGTRYSEIEIEELASNPKTTCRIFKLKDRFGDQGLISAVILKLEKDNVLVIDTWVMSCRVLGRGMEEFIASEILKIAQSVGAYTVEGSYIISTKNGLVAGLYERLGFTEFSGDKKAFIWRLDVSQAVGWKHFIARES